MVKVTTFNDRFVRHARYMPDGTVILKLYERRPCGRARYLRVRGPSGWSVAASISSTATPRDGLRPGRWPGDGADDENPGVFQGIGNRE